MRRHVLPTAPSPTVTHLMNLDALIFSSEWVSKTSDLLLLHLWKQSSTQTDLFFPFNPPSSPKQEKPLDCCLKLETLSENRKKCENKCDQMKGERWWIVLRAKWWPEFYAIESFTISPPSINFPILLLFFFLFLSTF